MLGQSKKESSVSFFRKERKKTRRHSFTQKDKTGQENKRRGKKERKI